MSLNQPNEVMAGMIRQFIGIVVSKKANHKTIKNDLIALVNRQGSESLSHMFVCLMENMDVTRKEQANARSSFLLAVLNEFSMRENFLSYFGQVIRTVCEKGDYFDYIVNFCKGIKVSLPTQVIVGLAMVLCSDPTVSHDGNYFLIKKLAEHQTQGKPFTFPPRVLQELFHLRQREDYANLDNEFKFIFEHNPLDSALTRVEELFFREKVKMPYHYMAQAGSSDPRPDLPLPPARPCALLKELGPACTSSQRTLARLLGCPLEPGPLFECLLAIAEEIVHPGEYWGCEVEVFEEKAEENAALLGADGDAVVPAWNLTEFFSFCSEAASGALDWRLTWKWLDQPECRIT
jgi:hypothetical protein